MNEWFRICMEAPEESGVGGEGEAPPAEAPPAHVSAFENPDLWDAPPGDEPPAEEPPPAETPPPAEAPAAAQPDGWSAEDWGAFQKKYPGGSPADLWKHYSNLQSEYSRVKNGVPPQAPAEEEPAAAPPGFTHPDYSILGPIPSDGLSVPEANALSALMAEDPKAAAYWALANSHKLTEPEFDAVQNGWAASDPQGYRRFWAENDARIERERQETELGPRLATVDEAMQREGAAMAQAAIPEITAHLEAFKGWLEARPELDEHLATLTQPDQVKNALITSFYQFYGPYRMEMDATEAAAAAERERIAAEEATAAEEAAKTAQSKARTATRGAPAAPSGGEASADDIRSAIMNAGR